MDTTPPTRLIHFENLDAWIEEKQKWRHPASIILLSAVLLLGMGLRLGNMNNVPSRSPDEHIYTLEAKTIRQEGLKGIGTIVDKFRSDPKLFYYPPPNRVGYLWLLARIMAVTGNSTTKAGAWLSCIASLGSMLMVVLLGWQFFNERIAILASLFYAVSPIELALARRAWQETVVELLALVLIYVVCKIMTSERVAAWLALFLVTGAICITVKELASLVFIFSTLWLLWIFVRRRDWEHSLILLCGAAVASGAAIMWEAHYFGGIHTFVDFSWSALHPNLPPNPYSAIYEGGAKYRLLESVWILCPATCLLCIVGLVTAFGKPSRFICERSAGIAIWLAVYFTAFLVLPMIAPNRLNLRFVNVLLGPFCLLAALGFLRALYFLRGLLDKVEARVFTAVMIVAVMIAAYADYDNFRSRFVNQNVLDLSVKMVLDTGNLPLPALVNVGGVPSAEIQSQLVAAMQLATSQPTPEHWMQLAYLLHQAGRLPDSVAALQASLKIKPDSPEAYNDLAVVYGAMHDWDDSINSAQQALKLKPDYELARKNLDTALENQRNSVR